MAVLVYFGIPHGRAVFVLQLDHLKAGVAAKKLPFGLPTNLEDIFQACRQSGFEPDLVDDVTLSRVQAEERAAAALSAAELRRVQEVRHRASCADRGLLLAKLHCGIDIEARCGASHRVIV
eukprot:SAG31_NODE_962_length_10731_cov_4.198552_8_plen_121_part_00